METTRFHRYWVQIIILLTFFQYGFYYDVGQINFLTLLDDLLILLLYIYLIFAKVKKQYVTHKKSKYDIIFIGLVVLAFISAALNQIPLINFIVGMKSYFLYFLFFYCIYWINFSSQESERIIKFSLKLFIIELLIALVQLGSAILNHNLNADSILGTFSGSNFLGYSAFVLLYFSLYRYYFDKKKEYFKYVIILTVLLLMSSARFAIMLFPLVFLVLNPVKIFSKITLAKIILILLIIILVPFFVNNSFMFKNEKIQDYFTFDFVKTQFSETEYVVTSGSARNLWYPLTRDYLEEYSYSPLIGFGPGMYASYTAMRFMPPSELRIYDYFHQTSLGLDPEVDSQIIPIWGELGYLGIIIFYALLIFMLVRMISIFRKVKDPILKAISSTAAAYCIFFIIGFYVRHVLETQTAAILLFFFVGVTEAQYRIVQSKLKKNSSIKKDENTID